MPETRVNTALCTADSASLLIVDVQTHLTAVMPAKVLARLQRNTGLLIQAAGKLDIPVFATEQYPAGLGKLEADIQKLLPADTPVYEKTCFSVSAVGEFMTDLENSARKQVVITGMEAHVCILQSAMQLAVAGYEVFVVADAVCSRHRESYEIALQRMSRAGVAICDAESVVFEWFADAKHPHFKSIQSLIR